MMIRQKPLLWKVNQEILRAAHTISYLILKSPTDRKTERRRPNLRLHCIPPAHPVSDFGAMRFRFRQTASGRYLYFPQFSIEFKRVPCKTPCYSATTGSNCLNSKFPATNNSQGRIFSQNKPKMTPISHVARVHDGTYAVSQGGGGVPLGNASASPLHTHT